MNKRDWNSIAENLCQLFDNEESESTTNTIKRQRTQDDNTGYSIKKDDISFTMSKRFLDSQPKIKNGKYYHIHNSITNQKARISSAKNLTILALKQKFESIGHCLAYDMTQAYTTKLMFDLDCRNCKSFRCNNPIEAEMIEMSVLSEVCEFVNKILSIANSQDLCVVFKKRNSCNLHIYFNITVSIVLYEMMKKRLPSTMSESVVGKYKVDDITSLDLPYSTKDGFELYKPIIGTNYDWFTCLPDDEFYDVPINISMNETYSSTITLGHFTVKNTNWYKQIEEVKYLTIPIEFEVYKTKIENSIIKNIKLSNLKFLTDYAILEEYFSTDDMMENSPALVPQSFEFNLNSPIKERVFAILITLGRLVCTNVYDKEPNNLSDHQILSYLLRFMTINNCNYFFYSLCATIRYCYGSDNKTNPVDHYRKPIIDILMELAKGIAPNNEILLHTLESTYGVECMANMESVFMKCNAWFLYMSKIVKFNSFQEPNQTFYDQCISYITSYMKVYETIESLLEDMVEFCKLVIPLIKMSNDGKTYYYKDGIYIGIASERFLSRNTLQVQSIELAMQKLLRVLVSNNQTTEEMVKKLDLKNVWILYLEGLDITIPQFNFYDYFISTKLGVFNTITGLYMEHTPLLPMCTQKAYCKIPTVNVEEMKIYEVNKHILHEQNEYKSIVDVIVNNQQALFFGSVVIPGLMSMVDTICTLDQENSILECLYQRLLADSSVENVKFMYWIEPVIAKYKFNIDKLYKFSKIIKMNLKEHGEYTRASINRYCKGNKIETLDVESKFVFNDNLSFYDNLCEIYGDKFNAKLFLFATFIAVFDVSQNGIFDSFEFKNVESTSFELPKTHIFYQWRCMNFSIKKRDNIKRVVEYLLPKDQNVTEAQLNLIYSISIIFNFDSVVIKDFVSMMSMIYQHNTSRKKMVFLVGSMKSGKSTFQHMLIDMHGQSVYSVDGIVQMSGQGPSPEIIHTHTNYLFSVIEMKSITANTLKGLIGSDIVHKRFCHQNDMHALRPLAFAIAAANKMPSIHQADEAVRDRIAPFLFTRIFIDESVIDSVIDDNQLLVYVCNYMITDTKFKVASVAREFSNILYEHFANIRNESGLAYFTLSDENISSEKLIRSCLIRNNAIYKLLYDCGITFGKNLSISYEEIKLRMEPKLEMFNETSRVKWTWDYVKNEISMLFKNKETLNQSEIQGIGFKEQLAATSVGVSRINDLLIYDELSEVNWRDLKFHLFHIKKLPFDEIASTFKKLKVKYRSHFNEINNTFKNHKIKT